MANQTEAKMEIHRERQRPKGHKPECLCWYCRRPPVPEEAAGGARSETGHGGRAAIDPGGGKARRHASIPLCGDCAAANNSSNVC